MQLSKIRIKNYRLLIDAELEVDPKTTLIVGRNNTAKTSCFSCIGNVLEGKTVSFNDYPLFRREDFYTKIALFMEKKLSYEELCKQIEVVSIDFLVDYSLDDPDDNLGALSPFIIDVDVNTTTALIRAEYRLKTDEKPCGRSWKAAIIRTALLLRIIVCYKLDRVGRKTADLIRLMDFLEMYHVDLLICSNGINTASGLYKIFIQIFAVIAEFERDTLTERIVDNMMGLAKDGRWLGGNTPMGFTVRRVTTGSGKGKSAYSYLESLPEEKCMVQRLYEIFRTTRSIQTTAKQMNEEGFHTPSGAAFNASTTRLVLRNPIYCTADKHSYDYFIDHDGNVFGDMIEFDGTHGLSAYNKTDQEKYEGSDSTFISPKYVQTIESKPVSEWIIAVGRHEGFIPSEQWIEVQELLEAIAEKYNRPHRKTNALLAGLAHCPHCGRRLSVISESDRWTNGKPRFKYVCPGYRKKECNFKAVDGVLLDEFVVQQLSELSDENSERFRRILEIKIEEVLEQSQTVQEHNIIKKKRDKLKADIAAQTRNLREADGSIKQFIQEDLQNLAEELRETERQLFKLDEGRKNNMIAIRDLEMTKERLLSFAEYAKDAQPEVLVTLIQTIVERIYIVDKDDERFCHIFIKGCTDEDYTGFFQTAGYIEQKTTPVCDSEQYCICT